MNDFKHFATDRLGINSQVIDLKGPAVVEQHRGAEDESRHLAVDHVLQSE